MRQRRKAPPNCGRTLWVRDSRPFRSLQGPFEVFASITLPAVRVDFLSVEEVTFEGSDRRGRQGREDHQDHPNRRWTSCSRRDRQKVLPEYRKSRRNASTASRLALPAACVNRRNASTAGRREVRIVESSVEERHAQYRQSKGESD